jgi:hypothetical protein
MRTLRHSTAHHSRAISAKDNESTEQHNCTGLSAGLTVLQALAAVTN